MSIPLNRLDSARARMRVRREREMLKLAERAEQDRKDDIAAALDHGCDWTQIFARINQDDLNPYHE